MLKDLEDYDTNRTIYKYANPEKDTNIYGNIIIKDCITHPWKKYIL